MLFKFIRIDPCCHSNNSKVAKFCITANGDFKAVQLGPRKKIIARCLHLPLFLGPGYPTVSFTFFPADPCCHGNEFWDKIDYNSAPAKDNCTLFSPTLYFRSRTMQWCHVNFSLENPCCHGNQPFFIQRQNWLQAHKSVKRWNAAARLYSMAVGQIPRSTERISSFSKGAANPPHSSSCKPRRLCFCFSQISFWQKLWRL